MSEFGVSRKLYLTSVEHAQGKSFISLGLISILKSRCPDLKCFKLFNEANRDKLVLLEQAASQSIPPILPINHAIKLMNQSPDVLINQVLEAGTTKDTAWAYYEGTDFESDNDVFEYQFNLTLATQLNCEVILVISAKDRTLKHTFAILDNALEIAKRNHTHIVGVVLNRVNPNEEKQAQATLNKCYKKLQIKAVVPEFKDLANPTMKDIAQKLEAKILCGENDLNRPIRQFTVAAKTVGNFLQTRYDRSGVLIITPDDRMDILLGSLLAEQSTNYPKIAGIVLTGGEMPPNAIHEIMKGLEHAFPVLLTHHKTFETATLLHDAKFSLSPKDMNRVKWALDTIKPYLMEATNAILESSDIKVAQTPAIFLYDLTKKAQKEIKHIVLPEGEDPRVLEACAHLLEKDVVHITLLGNPDKIKHLAKWSEINISKAKIIDIQHSPKKERYGHQYFELRKHKNISLPIAIERMSDVNYFATMMLYAGDADGMVSGAIHTTADTVRPALEIIKTKPGIQKVSSIFIMCLPTRILIYGDCAINPEPDSETLAEIAIAAANIADKLGIPPRIALLSYASGNSGAGESVQKVINALAIVKAKYPHLLIEGPIQYDAAVDPDVAQKKLPNSLVAGSANVLIFPDLNTGNNTYKAVQRETGALAIGPILLGLNKPVNDLSRGCTVNDIINTILVTAISAQESSCKF